MATERKRRKKSKLKIIFIVLAVIAVIAFITARNIKTAQTELLTTKVKIGLVEEKLTETGNIELLRTVEVKSKIAGTVQSILVNEGDAVKRDQVLCVIDPDPTQTLQLFQNRSSVDRYRINLEQAEKELTRMKELAKTSFISQKDLEDAQNSYLLASNSYSLAEQQLELMERDIETSGTGSEERIVSSKVRAPYDGYITKRYIEIGDLVTSGMSSMLAGTNVFQIGDPSTKIIRANISEVDIGKVKVGADVRIMLDAYPDTSFAGNIRHISPVGELQQGRNVITFKTEVEIIDKDPRLQPGMSCDIDVIIATIDSTRYLPVESVYEKREGSEEDRTATTKKIIYIKKDTDPPVVKKFGLVKQPPNQLDLYEEQPVEVGIRSETRFQLISDIDTSKVIVNDAELFFSDLRTRAEQDSIRAAAKQRASAN